MKKLTDKTTRALFSDFDAERARRDGVEAVALGRCVFVNVKFVVRPANVFAFAVGVAAALIAANRIAA